MPTFRGDNAKQNEFDRIVRKAALKISLLLLTTNGVPSTDQLNAIALEIVEMVYEEGPKEAYGQDD